MITLQPGTNTVVTTLTEKFGFYSPSVATYTDLYYIFKLTNELNRDEILFALDGPRDISPSPQRWNEFSILATHSATASEPNSQFVNVGYDVMFAYGSDDLMSQWDYEIWGCKGPMPSGTMSFPTDPTYPPRLLENGRLIFKQ